MRRKPINRVVTAVATVAVTVAMTAFFFTLNMRRAILDETLYNRIAARSAESMKNHPYNFFITMMTADYIERLQGVLPAAEIVPGFKKALPEETFRAGLVPVFKSVVNYLSGQDDEIRVYTMDIREFRTKASQFFLDRARAASTPAQKALLEHESYVISQYPDDTWVPNLRESMADLKIIVDRMGSWIVYEGAAWGILVLLLLWNIGTLGMTLALSGLLAVLFSFVPLADLVLGPKSRYLSQSMRDNDFIRTMAQEMVKSAEKLLTIEGAVVCLVGAGLVLAVRSSGRES